MLESLTGISALGDILDVHVVSTVPVVDTEVDPPQQNSISLVNDEEPNNKGLSHRRSAHSV